MLRIVLVLCGLTAAFAISDRFSISQDKPAGVSQAKRQVSKDKPVDNGQAVHRKLKPASWPPRPENFVNVTGSADHRKRKAVPIYKVPKDKLLVVTDMLFSRKVDVLERRKGDDNLKLPGQLLMVLSHDNRSVYGLSTGPIGLTFQPGSLVVISQPQRYTTAYHLRGYLADMK